MSTAQPAYVSDLAERAAERRYLLRALEVRCPRADHFHAGRLVPCYAPDAQHPWGRICLERVEKDIDTRGPRDAHAYRERARVNNAQARARIAAGTNARPSGMTS